MAQSVERILGKDEVISSILISSSSEPSHIAAVRVNFAGMMELADVPDSKSGGSDTVRVRPPPPAPEKGICSGICLCLQKRTFSLPENKEKNTHEIF